ncbi:MAG: hypothetical protein IMW97_08775 [Firmicutes bacterium]|nr:hypothetical protein [Candidatus Fermentithermobacillaceae bacterium]
MSFPEIRWAHVLIALAVTLSILSGGYVLYRRFWLTRPIELALKSDPDVEEVSVETGEQGIVVRVRMGPVKDLAVSYARLEEVLVSRLGDSGYRIVLEDRRDEELEEAYHAIHFFIAEAAQRGNFSEMADRVEKTLRPMGLGAYRVTVTGKAIFVQIFSPDRSRYLYEIVDRFPETGSPTKGGGA